MALYIDFETYCDLNLAEVSSYKYMHHESADVVCMAFKTDDLETRMWAPSLGSTSQGYLQLMLDGVRSGQKIYAHNALFEYLCWNVVCVKRYDFPPVLLSQFVDTQAMCQRYTLPGALEKAGAVLELKVQKNPRGKALIKLISCPTPAGKRPIQGRDYTHNDCVEYLEYCRRDVDMTYELVQALPASTLSDDEQYYWEMTQRMNCFGLPVDVGSAARILAYVQTYVTEMTREVPKLCDGAFQRVTQTQKLRAWAETFGVDMPNCTAETVEKLLASGGLPAPVKQMLDLRQALGRSSTAKYVKIQEMNYEGRVFNNLLYSGAATGRWTGMGFQMHNLPRASVKDPAAIIERFNSFLSIDDPVNTAKALIRPMIKAPEGRLLIVSDYKSIENRILMWLAFEEDVLESIRAGRDQYVEMAAYMYHTDYETIKSGHVADDKECTHMRRIGKIIVLGCGFQMGGARFQSSAAEQGVELSSQESFQAVSAFRSKHAKVKALWKGLTKSCVSAIQNPGRKYEYNRCTFSVVRDRSGNKWLVLALPSGRNLFYKDPYLSDDKYGLAPSHYGVNPKTKQWSKRKLIPGRITENIVQALARDVMANGLRNVEQNLPEVTLMGTVHDEGLGEIDEVHDANILDRYNEELCRLPAWAEGMPIEAEGYVAKRYRKG